MKFISVLFILVPLISAAQRVKYKDLVVTLPGLSAEQQKTELKEYIMDELDHPNANFRLALLYEKNYKTADPLTAYHYAMANAEQTKIRYLKSKQLVDEREVGRNNEYYAPIFKIYDAKGKPAVPFALVANKMSGGYDSASLFIDKMPAIYANFTRSVNFYDEAVKIFAQISNQYNSPEDLYLLYDAGLNERFTQLKTSYDSCIHFLDRYLQLIKEYPLRSHNQIYKIQSIETYRLDGLITKMNFLAGTIDLWNYGAWVDNVRKMVNTEVIDLRQKIEATNRQLDESLAKISASPADQLPQPVKIEKHLVFNLNHFDRQSVILSLFNYKSFRQEWEILSRSQLPDTAFSNRNAEVLTTLIYANRKADTLIKEFKSRINELRVNKHKEFVTKYYGGQAGLIKYAADEEKHIQSSFDDYSNQLRENIIHLDLQSQTFTNKDNVIKSGRFAVPLLVQSPTSEGLDQGLLFTQFNQKNPDGSVYIAGLHKPDKKKNLISTYVLRINPDGKVAWFKDLTISVDSAAVGDAHNYPGPVVLTQEGPALLVRSVHATRGDVVNTFVYLNEKGEEKLKTRLKDNAYPRFLQYSEKSNSFVMTLKGTEEKQQYSGAENIVVLSLNVLGEQIWRREIQLTGTLTDFTSVADGYLVAGNYTMMRDQNGKEVRTKAGASECSPYIVKLGERGELIHSRPITTPHSVYLHRVVKINDRSVNLLCYAENLDAGLGKTFSPQDKMVHILTNRQAQIVFAIY